MHSPSTNCYLQNPVLHAVPATPGILKSGLQVLFVGDHPIHHLVLRLSFYHYHPSNANVVFGISSWFVTKNAGNDNQILISGLIVNLGRLNGRLGQTLRLEWKAVPQFRLEYVEFWRQWQFGRRYLRTKHSQLYHCSSSAWSWRGTRSVFSHLAN